jgi:MarR family transcriptional regulator, organic hydroperoxide resistance regulator
MGTHEDPAQEAWQLLWQVMQANKPRMMALAQEMGLAPMQLHALRLIEPGEGMPMSSLAGMLFCDASNVTGIVDRLEARGLIERRPSATDRRVKLLVLTAEGARLRESALRQMSTPPPEIAALPLKHKEALRDALRAAIERQGRSERPAPASAR